MNSEKDMLLDSWDREFKTTMKVLKSYPLERQDYKPNEKSKSAKELAWNFPAEEIVFIPGVIAGNIDFTKFPKVPMAMKDVLSEYEKSHNEMMRKIKTISEEEMNKKMKFQVAPKTMMDVRKIDILWGTIQDMIHHRGQFSVYLRLVGARVPSIYGPSADEPWSTESERVYAKAV